MRDIEEYRYINGSRTINSFVTSDRKVDISRITGRSVDGNITTGKPQIIKRMAPTF
jgi:hypothetical protein